MKFKVPIVATIEAPSYAEAVAAAQRVQSLLGDAGLKIMLQMKQVQLVDAKIDATRIVPA